MTESVLLEGLVRGAREAVEHAIEARVAARSGTSGAVSTLLYLAGACAQRCAFCTVPHERDAGHAQKTPAVALVASGAFDALLGALARRRGSTITLVGDDWAAHPEIDEILDRLARSSVRSSLLGPGTALARPELAGKVAGIASLDRVTVTLEASPETEAGRGIHDAIVGRAGAAVLVHEGIRRLRALGTVVEVAHVLTRESIGALPDLAEHCARHALPLSIAGFVPDRTHVPTFRPEAIIARMDEVRSALALAHERADGAIERVTGLPVCAVPSELASKLSSRWDSGDTEAWTKPTRGPCADCPASPQCVGVPTAYVRAHGAEGLARTDAPHRP